jgi:hypothetical protein
LHNYGVDLGEIDSGKVCRNPAKSNGPCLGKELQSSSPIKKNHHYYSTYFYLVYTLRVTGALYLDKGHLVRARRPRVNNLHNYGVDLGGIDSVPVLHKVRVVD